MREGLLVLPPNADKEEIFPQRREDAKSVMGMFKVFLSGHLKEFSGGRTEIELDTAPLTVGDALSSLWDEQASLRDRIINEQGEIRQHVNIFYAGRDVRRFNGLQTAIKPNAELHIFNAVSGG